MQEEHEVLREAYGALFVHQWHRYAVQQRDGSYWAVNAPVTDDLLAAHLTGQLTLGTYLLDEDSTCRVAVFDADGENGVYALTHLNQQLLSDGGWPGILEASRRGGHLWLFLAHPTPARLVRAWLLPYAQQYGIELYPKQDQLTPGGMGSLIRLPLGVHRRSRGWYPFLWSVQHEPSYLVPVGQTREDCLRWLLFAVHQVAVPEQVERALIERDQSVISCGERVEAIRTGHDGGEVISPSTGGAIRAWCQAQDIVKVIGRYVQLDARGVGSCPLGTHHYRGDLRPSLQVFGGNQPHWYCYTWGRAGDLFDFLCLYHNLSPQEGWERLKAGTL